MINHTPTKYTSRIEVFLFYCREYKTLHFRSLTAKKDKKLETIEYSNIDTLLNTYSKFRKTVGIENNIIKIVYIHKKL